MTLDLNKIKDDFTRLFFEYTFKMIGNSKMHEDISITPENIYQIAHKENRDLLFEIVNMSHLPGSTILGVDNLLKLHSLAQEGKSCIIFSEHVSNLDVPSMFVRFYQYPDERLKEIFEKIIFVAGVKLNENPYVKLYTEMFTRIVIFPIRSLDKMIGKKEFEDRVNLARKVNIKSTRKIRELRNQGYIFVMYPAGTRYRPWDPDTKKGIKETTSYLRSFDCFCCSSITGNNMIPEKHEDMTGETYKKDIIVFNFGEVKNTKDYINNICKEENFESVKDSERIKQFVVDSIMKEIDDLHEDADNYISEYKKRNQ